MSNFRKQLNKGVLELGILKLLCEQDHYGYSLIQEMNKIGTGGLELKEGTLYPILYRLEDSKLIESYWEPTEGRGKPRKYYKITDEGRKTFKEMLEDYRELTEGVNNILHLK